MRTPAGAECAHYYQDHHRGRAIAECRLPREAKSPPWTSADCSRCLVPGILAANGSPDLELTLWVRKGFLGIGGGLSVIARCGKHDIVIEDPYTGCPECIAEMFEGIDLGGTDV